MEYDLYWSQAELNQQWTNFNFTHSPPDIFKQKENKVAKVGMHALNSKNPEVSGDITVAANGKLSGTIY